MQKYKRTRLDKLTKCSICKPNPNAKLKIRPELTVSLEEKRGEFMV